MLPPGYPVEPPPVAPGYAPAGYPPYPATPPGYGPPGYGAPPSYGPPPGYGPPLGYPAAPPGCGPPPGYGPPLGYGPPVAPGAVKPGIIPLRPLTLSDIFNGAVGYIRANPKATLGLTAMVVVTLQIISLVALFGPMTAFGDIVTGEPDELTGAVVGGWSASFGASLLVSWLAGVLLSGMLTVIVGRAVFGSPITVGEAWAKVRGRLLALFGLALLEAAGVVAVLGLAVVILSGVAAAANEAAAALLGFPLLLVVGVSLAYLYVVLLFAPVLIVLERLPIVEAITRSFALVRHGFWRVLGIRLLTVLVVGVVGNAIAAPFMIVGEIVTAVTASDGSVTMRLVGRYALGHRSDDRPDCHRAVQRRSCRAVIHRPPYPCRGLRPGIADRLRSRPRRRARPGGVHRQPMAHAAFLKGVSEDRLTVPSIDIDREAAHQAAQRELDKPIYPKDSLTKELTDWIDEQLYRILEKGSSIPGGWFTITVLLILLMIAVTAAVQIARRTMRTNRGGDYQLFDAGQLTAAQHRSTAESYAAEGNWAAAIRHRLQAVARELEETGMLNPAAGRTANELASDAGEVLPHLAGELTQAATAFNDVTYGERPGTQGAYQMIADLDDHLRSRSPAVVSAVQHPAVFDSWAQVR